MKLVSAETLDELQATKKEPHTIKHSLPDGMVEGTSRGAFELEETPFKSESAA